MSEAIAASASESVLCSHYAEYDLHGELVQLPDPMPSEPDQWMRIVLLACAHAQDGLGFHGFNVRAGAIVRAVSGTILLHTWIAPDGRGRSARAFQLDRCGRWVDVARDVGTEWAVTIRDRVRTLIDARLCPLAIRACRSANGSAAGLRDQVEQHRDVDGLHDVLVESGLERASTRLGVGPAGDRDDAHRLHEPVGANAPRDLVAVEIGEAQVEQHELR